MIKFDFPNTKRVALLLDPDKSEGPVLEEILGIASEHRADYIFTGGSLTFNSVDNLIDAIREKCNIPVILFPGNLLQLSRKADAVLLLSLISGRNPDLLIGNHVIAAPYLRDIRKKLISVGYILIGSGQRSSVEYISNTCPIPADKPEIAVATALAGEMLGLKMIYLEGGSGASNPVPPEIIRAVRSNISIPVAVGGGLKLPQEIMDAFDAGADLIVLGNGCEKNPHLLADACKIRDNLINRRLT
ncbi:MAG TPA: geranylgeranylglyceryl/heptaprenylglyceryl phosphate synthase [Bacteroidales bacterium]|jgi:putative glycerol-1-phosphate prenyltransferase|nr:geranylgeranylglyceryl/heptaprenylglyceryl phosphate synthase [Bacteroidales bacterium]HNR42167.1 geranylgeranylglyceryl/heptaprenylglyceryl phosphate synthase [Bacteroidales bacterium]HQG77982.1 geranylgeranylglyceryl/heptaprenylglyceryl phosphate synthase [Bacteroidales bacterium]